MEGKKKRIPRYTKDSSIVTKDNSHYCSSIGLPLLLRAESSQSGSCGSGVRGTGGSCVSSGRTRQGVVLVVVF